MMMFSCQHCDVRTESVEDLILHEKLHKCKYNCNICEYKSNSLNNYSEHLYRWHDTGLNKAKCYGCNKPVPYEILYEISQLPKNTKYNVKCDTCDIQVM